MDKGVEFDEYPIRLDYDGDLNATITQSDKGVYKITFDDRQVIE